MSDRKHTNANSDRIPIRWLNDPAFEYFRLGLVVFLVWFPVDEEGVLEVEALSRVDSNQAIRFPYLERLVTHQFEHPVRSL